MPVRESQPEPAPYPADNARGAEIELRRPLQRYVFVGGLAGMVLGLIVLKLFAA